MERLREQVFTANVLVVDDVLANVELLRMALTRAGYKKITAVQDPREVVDLDKQIGFDMVLLDLQMPHMDGFQVMEYLRSNHPGELLPILILTAQIDRPTRLKALRAGATDFVTKPFDVDELMNRVGNLVEMRLLYLERRDQAAILETKVRERTRELEEMRNEILRVLGRAGEYRDNETGAHVIRVAKSCGLLARALGQDVDWAEMLMNASPLHDVGKIGVPDAILLKPGKLEPAEFERMKKHVEIGADIVPEGKSALLDMGRRVVLTHHEKWNGTGYPAGLKGEGIPLEGRIAAICDVFDALTSARPYKPAWPVDEALDLLKAQAGQQFDPRVVEAFLTIVPEVVALRTQFSDDNEAEKVRA